MFRFTCLYMILMFHYELHRATPLIGQDVRMANSNEFSFIVSISWNDPENLVNAEMNHICGGTLITRKHILTAAHCLTNNFYDQIIVKIGSIDLRNAEIYQMEWWLTYSSWANITVPTDYDEDSLYDIAVIKLERAVSSNIDLPVLSYLNATTLYGSSVKIAGWGKLANNEFPRYLRVGKFFVMHPEECEVFQVEKDSFLREIRPKIYLCTSTVRAAKITCGDSGSPLLSKDNHLLAVNKAFCLLDNDTEYSKIRNLHSFVHFYAGFIDAMKVK